MIEFIRVSKLCDNVVLGIPFMKTYVENLTIKNNEIKLAETAYLMIDRSDHFSPLAMSHVKATVAHILGGALSKVNSYETIVQPLPLYDESLSIPNCMVKVLNGKCLIRIANFTNGSQTRNEVTPVGILMPKCDSLFTIPVAELQPKNETQFNHVTTIPTADIKTKLSDSDKKFLSEFNFEDSTLTLDEQEQVKKVLLQHKSTFVWEEYPQLGVPTC